MKIVRNPPSINYVLISSSAREFKLVCFRLGSRRRGQLVLEILWESKSVLGVKVAH